MPVFKDSSNNTWSASFYYTDWTGQRRRKKKVGFKTRREALAFEENFKSKAAGATTMTFGELYELYMEDARVRLKPTTYRNKEFIIKLKVLPFFKDLPISSITPAIIRKWQNQMLSATYTPFGKQKTAQPYTQTYLKTIDNQVSAIFNFAVKYYHLPQNPVRLCGSMGKNGPTVSASGRSTNSANSLRCTKTTSCTTRFSCSSSGPVCAKANS